MPEDAQRFIRYVRGFTARASGPYTWGMNRYERILVWLLRLGGAVMLTALGAVVMPFEAMNVIHQQTGLGELPHVPIVGYLTRSISALYALHGALLVFLASDVRRYLPVVRFLAIAGAVFGVVMLGIDCAVGMPLPWTAGEGPYVIALSAVILWLTGPKRFPSPAAAV
jgi:hypothetical protein